MSHFADLIAAGQVDTDEGIKPLHSNVTLADAEAVHAAAQDHERAIEIGLAFGVASLAILEASPHGTLTSIDPDQTRGWLNGGVRSIGRAGLADRHTLVEEPDYLALPALLRNGATFDFAFVDGWHSFDFVMLDMFYVDRLLEIGGVVGFDDCDWPAVQKALAFVGSHIKWWEPIGTSVRRRGLRRPPPHRVRFFRKVDEGKVHFDFYAPF